MAKKTNKTSHVLNLITGGTTEPEAEKQTSQALPSEQKVVVVDSAKEEQISPGTSAGSCSMKWAIRKQNWKNIFQRFRISQKRLQRSPDQRAAAQEKVSQKKAFQKEAFQENVFQTTALWKKAAERSQLWKHLL